MGWAYAYQGRHDQAVREFVEALRLQNVKADSRSLLRHADESAGMKGYWRTWLELYAERIAHGRISPFHLAQIDTFLGEKDRAFSCLQQACEDHSVRMPAPTQPVEPPPRGVADYRTVRTVARMQYSSMPACHLIPLKKKVGCSTRMYFGCRLSSRRGSAARP